MSDIQSINNDHFNKTAQDYDNIPQAKEMTQRASEVILQEFLDSTSEEHVKNASVLDFGCGTGLCAFHIARKVKHVLGVDASEGMLKHLNHKLATDAENASIRDKITTVQHLVKHDDPLPEAERLKYLAGPDDGFDMIFSNYVMHHIEDLEGIVNVLANRLLKKDGWLIVLDFEGIHGHHGHGEGEGHSHGHGHGHAHGGHHRHHGHNHGEGHQLQDIHSLFVDKDGKPLEYVAHKGGFTPERFAEIFKKAGLVDVAAKHSFGMERDMKGKKIWTDVLVVKGRRA